MNKIMKLLVLDVTNNKIRNGAKYIDSVFAETVVLMWENGGVNRDRR